MASNYAAGSQSGEDVTQKLKQDLGSKAREASRQFADKGKEKAEAMTDTAADALDDAETIAEKQAEELERLGWDNLSGYVHEMADGIGHLSTQLRDKSVDELVRSAAELARRNTGLFLLGSIAIGFGLSRLAKAAPAAQTGAEPQRAATPGNHDANNSPAAEHPAPFDPFAGDEYRPYESH